MNMKLSVALLLLIAAIVPVSSIAMYLLVWGLPDPEIGCRIVWIGVLPEGGYCT